MSEPKPVVIMTPLPAWICPECRASWLLEMEMLDESEIPAETIRRMKAEAEANGDSLDDDHKIGGFRMKAQQTCENCGLEVIVRPPYIGFEP